MESPIQTDFIRWIVFLPLIGSIVNGLLGAKIQKSLGKGAIGVIACAPVIIAFGLSVHALITLKNLAPEKRFLIHIYATGYMHDDKAFWRFFAYLNLFTAAMLTLVLGDNLLVLFVGWEGVGLCSYALLGFWYQD